MCYLNIYAILYYIYRFNAGQDGGIACICVCLHEKVEDLLEIDEVCITIYILIVCGKLLSLLLFFLSSSREFFSGPYPLDGPHATIYTNPIGLRIFTRVIFYILLFFEWKTFFLPRVLSGQYLLWMACSFSIKF